MAASLSSQRWPDAAGEGIGGVFVVGVDGDGECWWYNGRGKAVTTMMTVTAIMGLAALRTVTV